MNIHQHTTYLYLELFEVDDDDDDVPSLVKLKPLDTISTTVLFFHSWDIDHDYLL